MQDARVGGLPKTPRGARVAGPAAASRSPSGVAATRTPSTRERREARRAAILTDMLAVVERLIGEGTSYAEITVDRLIAEADIARSTFYVYFEGKGALLIATSRRR